MGHSTGSGRRTNAAPESTQAVQRGDLEAATRAQDAYDRGRLATARERRAVDNFLENRKDQLNSEKGAQIAANEFEYANMSNERALEVINASGRDRYEIYEERQPGSVWTNGAPLIKRYIRKVNAGQSRAGQPRRGLSESAMRAIRATEYSARHEEEERRRGQEAARNMTRSYRRGR